MLIQSTKSRQYISTFNYCNLNVIFPMGLDAVLKSIVLYSVCMLILVVRTSFNSLYSTLRLDCCARASPFVQTQGGMLELLICSVICDSTQKKSGSLGIIFFEEQFLLSSILRLKKTQGKTHKARGVLGVFVLLQCPTKYPLAAYFRSHVTVNI